MSDEKKAIEERDRITLDDAEIKRIAKILADMKKTHPKDFEALLSSGIIRRNGTVVDVSRIYSAKSIIEMNEEPYLLMFQGNGTNELRSILSSKTLDVDLTTGTGIAKKDNFTMKFTDAQSLRKKLSFLGCLKLYDIATILLTKNNKFRAKGEINRTVSFDLQSYADFVGADIVPMDDSEKEQKRAKTAYYHLRQKITKELQVLKRIVIDWKEPRARVKEKIEVSLADETAISKDGQIRIIFGSRIAKYLVQEAFIMQYHRMLLQADTLRQYQIGYKLCLNASIKKNKETGRDGLISVHSLLAASGDFPTSEKVMETGGRMWKRDLQKPLEDVLDFWAEMGLFQEITNENGKKVTWEYCLDSNKIPFDRREIDNHNTFQNLYIKYKMVEKNTTKGKKCTLGGF